MDGGKLSPRGRMEGGEGSGDGWERKAGGRRGRREGREKIMDKRGYEREKKEAGDQIRDN